MQVTDLIDRDCCTIEAGGGPADTGGGSGMLDLLLRPLSICFGDCTFAFGAALNAVRSVTEGQGAQTAGW